MNNSNNHRLNTQYTRSLLDETPKRAPSLLAYLGILSIFFALMIYVSLSWKLMTPNMQMIIVLVSGIGLTLLTVITIIDNKYPMLILPLILISASIQLNGWCLLANQLFTVNTNLISVIIMIYGWMLLQFSLGYRATHFTSLLILSEIFAFLTAYYLMISTSIDNNTFMMSGVGLILISANLAIAKNIEKLLNFMIVLSSFALAAGLVFFACFFNTARYQELVIGIILLALGLYSKRNRHSIFTTVLFIVSAFAILDASTNILTKALSPLFSPINSSDDSIIMLVAMTIGFALLPLEALLSSLIIFIATGGAPIYPLIYQNIIYYFHSFYWPIGFTIVGILFVLISIYLQSKQISSRE